MGKDIDTRSKSILNFRPKIDFVEPAQEPQQPNPIAKPVAVEDDAAQAEKIRSELFNLASAVDVLAAAVQGRIDRVAKDIVIKLDPKVDAEVIAALKRQYDASDEITYAIYKECRDSIRQYADDQAAKNHITEQQIDEARAKLPNTLAGGWGTEKAKNGGLRPELNVKAQLIEPLDVEKFQDYLIRLLINFIWKHFLRPPLASIPGADLVLPDELTKIPDSFKQTLEGAKDKGVKVLS